MNTATLSRLRDLTDALGNINLEVLLLERQAAAIKAELAAAGEPEIEGRMFRAAITLTERTTLDPRAAINILSSIGMEVPMRSTFVSSVRVSQR